LINLLDDLFLKYSELKKTKGAMRRHTSYIQAWFSDFPLAINQEETNFIKYTDDLMCLSADRPLLWRLFETKIAWKIAALSRTFSQGPAGANDRFFMYSDCNIEAWGFFAVLVTTSFMLISPLWILQAIDAFRVRLAVITFFIIACICLLTFATQVRPLERLAAAAGYSAVLVVFLQIDIASPGAK
jgi:hypothetical protein